MTEPNSISCTQLAETYNISHDSVNRLEREDYTPHNLYQEKTQHIDNNELIIILMIIKVLDKPYSNIWTWLAILVR